METLIFAYSWMAVGILSGILAFYWYDKWKTLGHLLAWIFIGFVFGYIVIFGIMVHVLTGIIEKSILMDWLNMEVKETKDDIEVKEDTDDNE